MLNEAYVEMARKALEDRAGRPGCVSILTRGFRAAPSKTKVASASGPHAIVAKVTVNGWGTAFEAVQVSKQIIIDLRMDLDQLRRSTLDQTRSLTDRQVEREALAQAVGIQRPLSRSEFVDPARLTGRNMSKLSVTMIRQVQAVAKLYLEHESQRLERVSAARQAANGRRRPRGRAAAL